MKQLRKKGNREKNIFYWAVLAFPILQFVVFYIGVNINSFALAFQEFDLQGGGFTFVGFKDFFKNFIAVFEEFKNADYLLQAFNNSIIAYLVGLFVGLTLSLLFSYYLYKKFAMSNFFKVILFLPFIISSITLVIIYKYFVESAIPEFVLQLTGTEIDGLLSNIDTEFVTILFFSIWTGFGIQTLIYSSAMSGISNEIVDAAKIDGVTPMKEFLLIDIPMIMPTIAVFVVSSTATIFVNQINLYSFYGPDASNYSIWTIGYYMYRGISAAPSISVYPYYAAFGLVMTMITIPITLIVRSLMNKIDPNEG
ncbi:MAG: sugar ABC transporter permease [Oscillospiraceae bacterium]|nr:sugar ABC transporter permease [Oscillospiraceae bacterium]